MKRIFVTKENVSGNLIAINGSDVHHIKNVLRKKINDILSISDGEFVYNAEIRKFLKDKIILEIVDKKPILKKSYKLRLFQAIPKGKVIEEIIEKTTELGVSEFIPIFTERTIVKFSKDQAEKKINKWRKISYERAKKVGINHTMQIFPPSKLEEIESFVKNDEIKILFWESEEEKNLKSILSQIEKEKMINIIIGPEGGFSAREVRIIKDSGFVSVSLGERIYTVETAILVAVSNIIFYLENFL